jgi:hypothetical protein
MTQTNHDGDVTMTIKARAQDSLGPGCARARIYSMADSVSYLSGKGKTLLRMNVEARGRTDATEQIPVPDVLLQDGQRLAVGGLATGRLPERADRVLPPANALQVGRILPQYQR